MECVTEPNGFSVWVSQFSTIFFHREWNGTRLLSLES